MTGKFYKRLIVLATLVGTGLGAGCSTMNNTEKDATIGGALGAATGLAIGAVTHNPKTGAVVGGLAGAGVGGLIGNEQDKKEKQQADDARLVAAQQAQAAMMTIADVIAMTQQGQSDATIINRIRATGSIFNPSTEDFAALKQYNVTEPVIQEIATSRMRAGVPQPRTVIVQQAPPGYGPPVVYTAPPPPVVVGVGGPVYYGGYGYRRGW
ncbi:glycine zipper domain-containing protein [Fimbriiglobus ruber]|uniref:Glycine zipper domain-containing protein n=1 Tax=Fimbriiglobus ruber TaxID=1908690 RepID=A0A225DC60_9BACT|nr:glycine zipper domain-containing protein [Fimbriiglobus ruber]OWK34876.1 hypothetical protein FRUB_09718 [Fimbriiglobus ruber]